MSVMDFVTQAHNLISEGKREDAKKLLEVNLKEVPKDWKAHKENHEEIEIHFWDVFEYYYYLAIKGEKMAKKLVWPTTASYSKGYYLLAYLLVEEKKMDKALECIDKAINLEPDNPLILCEKALIYLNSGTKEDKEKAVEFYHKAIKARDWIMPNTMALAYRNCGVALIDLGKLEEAEKMLFESLIYEPISKGAINELLYIVELRKKGKGSADTNLILTNSEEIDKSLKEKKK